MNNEFKKEKISEYILYLFIISVYGVIYYATVNIYNIPIQIYLCTLSTILLVGVIIIKIFKKHINLNEFVKNDNKRNNFINIMILLYLVYCIINSLMFNPEYIFYSIVKYIPIALMVIIPLYLKSCNVKLDKIVNFISWIIICVAVISLIFYLFGNSYFTLSFSDGIIVEKTSKYIEIYGEQRLTSQFNHKSAYALYCFIGIFYILKNNFFNKIKKIFFILLLLINIYLSDSMMFLLLAIVYLIILGIFEFVNLLKNKKDHINILGKRIKVITIRNLIFAIIGILFLLFIIVFIKKLSEIRDVSSLNGRIYIWKAGIDEIFKMPLGRMIMPESNWLLSVGYQPVNNPHNVFLAEGIENGILGMVFYLIIYFMVVIKAFKSKNFKSFGLFLVLVFIGINFDFVVKNELSYIFFTTIGLVLTLINKEDEMSLRE